MKIFKKDNARIWKNAEFIIRDLGGGKPGENVVFIADQECWDNARALADTARELGLNPIIIDIDTFGGESRYLKFPVMAPLRAAILESDLCFMLTDQMLTDFGLFLGNSDDCDLALLGKSRRFTLEARGMDRWELDTAGILHYRERTQRLVDVLKNGRQLRLTSARGTDITCDMQTGVEAIYPVMAIIPFYVETAIIPKTGSVNGVVVADGASQCAYAQRGFPIRPAIPGYQELYMEPLRIELKDGVATAFDGPAIQVERLKKWMYSSTPHADLADEIGIVTTTSIENDMYGWLIDGTHQTHCAHLALGNNTRRNEVIHAPEHCDFDFHDPHITLDGQTIYANRKFNDALIFK